MAKPKPRNLQQKPAGSKHRKPRTVSLAGGLTPAEALRKGRRLIAERHTPSPDEVAAACRQRLVVLRVRAATIASEIAKNEAELRAAEARTTLPPKGEGVGVEGGSTPPTAWEDGELLASKSRPQRRRATKPENGADLSTGGGGEADTGNPVTEQDQGVRVVANSPEIPESSQPALRSAPAIVTQEINTRPEPDVVALFGTPRTERVTREPGTYRITDLGPEQCRYIAGDDHLCCGAPAPIGPGNLHGSWCEAHRAVVFDSRSGADRPVFVRMGRGR